MSQCCREAQNALACACTCSLVCGTPLWIIFSFCGDTFVWLLCKRTKPDVTHVQKTKKSPVDVGSFFMFLTASWQLCSTFSCWPLPGVMKRRTKVWKLTVKKVIKHIEVLVANISRLFWLLATLRLITLLQHAQVKEWDNYGELTDIQASCYGLIAVP